jgi:hypothetical protein
MTLEGLNYGEIWSNIGMSASEASSATWNLGTNSAFALGPRKTTEKLDRVGRSQELPDANRLLASSPALNSRTPTSPCLCCCFIWTKVYIVQIWKPQCVCVDRGRGPRGERWNGVDTQRSWHVLYSCKDMSWVMFIWICWSKAEVRKGGREKWKLSGKMKDLEKKYSTREWDKGTKLCDTFRWTFNGNYTDSESREYITTGVSLCSWEVGTRVRWVCDKELNKYLPVVSEAKLWHINNSLEPAVHLRIIGLKGSPLVIPRAMQSVEWFILGGRTFKLPPFQNIFNFCLKITGRFRYRSLSFCWNNPNILYNCIKLRLRDPVCDDSC